MWLEFLLTALKCLVWRWTLPAHAGRDKEVLQPSMHPQAIVCRHVKPPLFPGTSVPMVTSHSNTSLSIGSSGVPLLCPCVWVLWG